MGEVEEKGKMSEKKENGKREAKKAKSKKFLSGYIDFGILGKREACLFKNENKETEKQPSFRLFIREAEAWKEVGAFWVRELKEEEDEL